MGILYVMLGLILSGLIQQSQPLSEKEDTPSGTTTTTTFKKHFRIHKDTPEPIRPEDITITLNPENPGKNKTGNNNPEENENFILPLIWAYFQAYSQGLLIENSPLPWEETEDEIMIKNRRLASRREDWFRFLEYFPLTEGRKHINDPNKLKQLTIRAFTDLRK